MGGIQLKNVTFGFAIREAPGFTHLKADGMVALSFFWEGGSSSIFEEMVPTSRCAIIFPFRPEGNHDQFYIYILNLLFFSEYPV